MKFTSIVCILCYAVLFAAIHNSTCKSIESANSKMKQIKTNEIPENAPRHSLNRRRTPPQYMTYLLGQFEENSANSGTSHRSKHSKNGKPYVKKLFYAWLPTEINEAEEPHRAIATFQQTKPKRDFGNFMMSQITLTLRDDLEELELPEKTTVSMSIHWDESRTLQQDLIQTQPIQADSKYYSFNITEFISSCIQENLTEPYLVNISFHVTSTQGRAQMLDFERLFDVHVDLPIIVFFYNEFIEAEINSLKQRKSRKYRSINEKMEKFRTSRPTSQCQRREFLVSPEELQLNHIIGPKMLDLGFCSGSCQYPLLDGYYNYTMHSFLIDRFRMERTFNVPNGFPLSTCVPISYKPLSILEEVTADQYQGETVENMSVDTCGCR